VKVAATCPICRESSERLLAKSGGDRDFSVWWCATCHLGFNQFSSDRARDSINQEVFDRAHWVDSRESTGWIFRWTARQRLALLKHFRKGGSLLEVGCGTGEFVEQASLAGFEALGLDGAGAVIDRDRARYPELKFRQGYLPHPEIPERSLDVVAGFHVFEHVPDPLAFLGAVRDVLRPEGLVYLRLPNHRALARRLGGRRWYLPEHLFHHTPASVRSLLERSGFRVVGLSTYADGVGWFNALVMPVVAIYQHRRFGGTAGPPQPSDTSQAAAEDRHPDERRFLRNVYNATSSAVGRGLRPLGMVADAFRLGDEIVAVGVRT
jgi:SAM-dependent methyltransferase